MLNEAAPLSNATVPRLVAPSLNVTVPVGNPAPGAVAATVADSVVLCPEDVGLIDDNSVVVVADTFTA